MTDDNVDLIVKHWIGLPSAERAIMVEAGHTDVAMVGRYIRGGPPFEDNAAGYLDF